MLSYHCEMNISHHQALISIVCEVDFHKNLRKSVEKLKTAVLWFLGAYLFNIAASINNLLFKIYDFRYMCNFYRKENTKQY